MVGATYLCYEGAEKVWGALRGHDDEHDAGGRPRAADAEEKTVVAGAIRTDFILSAEIMVIALNEVADEPFVVAGARSSSWSPFGITILVYGVVALIVKMDDVGLLLAERPSPAAQRIGAGLVRGMPMLLSVISVVGIAAMLWVGGHILLVGPRRPRLARAVRRSCTTLEEAVHDAVGRHRRPARLAGEHRRLRGRRAARRRGRGRGDAPGAAPPRPRRGCAAARTGH